MGKHCYITTENSIIKVANYTDLGYSNRIILREYLKYCICKFLKKVDLSHYYLLKNKML